MINPRNCIQLLTQSSKKAGWNPPRRPPHDTPKNQNRIKTRALDDRVQASACECDFHLVMVDAPKMKSRTLCSCGRVAASLIAVACLCAMAWRSLNHISPQLPGTDSSIYACGGMFLLNGKALYKDFWEQKPPMIYFLNAAAMKAGGVSITAVRAMERLFAVAGAALVFLTILRSFPRAVSRLRCPAPFAPVGLAAAGCLLWLMAFYHPSVFEGGNLTEEYGTVFLLAGIVMTLYATQSRDFRRMLLVSMMAGVFFALSALTKEPFLLSVIPWIICMAWPAGHSWRNSITRVVACAGGVMIPLVLCVTYLYSHGAMPAWRDVMVHNRIYAAENSPPAWIHRLYDNLVPARLAFGGMITVALGCAAGVASIFSPQFQKRSAYLPLTLIAMLMTSYAATTLSTSKYGHYYLQLVPSCVLLAAAGIAYSFYLVHRTRHGFLGVFLIWIVILIACDHHTMTAYFGRIRLPFSAPAPDPISDFIVRNTSEDDYIWTTSGHHARYYFLTRRLPPTKYFSNLLVHYSGTAEGRARYKNRAERILSSLKSHPPKYIIQRSADPRRDLPPDDDGLMDWINQHYVPAGVSDGPAVLYRAAPSPEQRRPPQADRMPPQYPTL